MQLFKMCDKKHMVLCLFKSHNSSNVDKKSVQWYQFSGFSFSECCYVSLRVSAAKLRELILKSLNGYIVFKEQ